MPSNSDMIQPQLIEIVYISGYITFILSQNDSDIMHGKCRSTPMTIGCVLVLKMALTIGIHQRVSMACKLHKSTVPSASSQTYR